MTGVLGPDKAEDAFARKIREMESAANAAEVARREGVVAVPPPQHKVVEKTPMKPVVVAKEPRKPIMKRTSEEDQSALGRRFVGVSRMHAYQKGTKLGEGTFGFVEFLISAWH